MNVLAVVAVLCLGVSVSLEEDPLKVSVYYESYCPDCIRFEQDQLLDAWKFFKGKILIELVPFGNAKQTYIDGHWKFQCQHGPKECLGNKLHACAILQACGESGTVQCSVNNVTHVLNYIHCVEEEDDQLVASKKCAKAEGLEDEAIEKCAQNAIGNKLLNLYGNRTLEFEPPIQYVPSIAMDGKQNLAAEDDLKGEICKLMPSLCSYPDVETNMVANHSSE